MISLSFLNFAGDVMFSFPKKINLKTDPPEDEI